jgi:hypothetical protein
VSPTRFHNACSRVHAGVHGLRKMGCRSWTWSGAWVCPAMVNPVEKEPLLAQLGWLILWLQCLSSKALWQTSDDTCRSYYFTTTPPNSHPLQLTSFLSNPPNTPEPSPSTRNLGAVLGDGGGLQVHLCPPKIPSHRLRFSLWPRSLGLGYGLRCGLALQFRHLGLRQE